MTGDPHIGDEGRLFFAPQCGIQGLHPNTCMLLCKELPLPGTKCVAHYMLDKSQTQNNTGILDTPFCDVLYSERIMRRQQHSTVQ